LKKKLKEYSPAEEPLSKGHLILTIDMEKDTILIGPNIEVFVFMGPTPYGNKIKISVQAPRDIEVSRRRER